MEEYDIEDDYLLYDCGVQEEDDAEPPNIVRGNSRCLCLKGYTARGYWLEEIDDCEDHEMASLP